MNTNTQTNNNNNNNNETTTKIANFIVEYAPKIARRATFPAAYFTIAVFWTLALIACLAVSDMFTNMVSDVDDNMRILLTIVIYAVVFFTVIQHMREATERVFGWFPVVAAVRKAKAQAKARAKCPCTACAAKCHAKGE